MRREPIIIRGCDRADDVPLFELFRRNSWSHFVRQFCGKNKIENTASYPAFLNSPFRGSGPFKRWIPLYASSGV